MSGRNAALLAVGMIGVPIVAVVVLVVATKGAVVCLGIPCDAPPVYVSGEIRGEDGAAPVGCRVQVTAPPQRNRIFLMSKANTVLQEESIEARFRVGFSPNPFVEKYQVLIRCSNVEPYESDVLEVERLMDNARELALGMIVVRRTSYSLGEGPASTRVNETVGPFARYPRR